PPERLAHPLALAQQEPRVGEMEMDVGQQILRSGLEPKRVPQHHQRLAVPADLLEEHALLQEALAARVAGRDLIRDLERDIVLAFAEEAVPAAAELGDGRPLRERKRRAVRGSGQRKGLENGFRSLHPYRGRKYLIMVSHARPAWFARPANWNRF